ncbi:hypothetical protein BH09PSE5_BH09PSE5_40700 [soil metagenome]
MTEAAPDPLDDILHVTDALYGKLLASALATQARTAAPDPSLSALAESVLYAEARVLDGRLFDQWLDMFTKDCIYWVPSSQEASDPRLQTSIHMDDRRRLRDRIALIKTGHLHAQTPASRTCRVVTNVEAWPDETDPSHIVTRSNLVIWMYRHHKMVQHVGWQEHTLVPAASGIGFDIRYKVLHLLDNDGPQGNITFIL